MRSSRLHDRDSKRLAILRRVGLHQSLLALHRNEAGRVDDLIEVVLGIALPAFDFALHNLVPRFSLNDSKLGVAILKYIVRDERLSADDDQLTGQFADATEAIKLLSEV